MKVSDRKKAAKNFISRWADRGNEKQDSQSFWLDLLQTVYGIESPSEYITFENSVSNMMDSTSFIDGYIETTNVLIEQKGQHKDLNKGIKQSDGTFLTPFQQALRYSATLPYSRRPRWIITSNFKEFYIYDMEQPNSEPAIVKLENLEHEYYRLEILADKTNTKIQKETEVSIQAGELIGQIYDELIEQYHNPDDPHTLKSINQLSVRLVFSFYAEDAGLFGKKGMFHDYLVDFDSRNFRRAIIEFFHVLNTKIENRDPYLDESLARFPYVNGGLFEDMDIEIPQFTDHLRELILENASSEFDWSEISPTIFGGVFESTLNPAERRKGGMHYTSIENIHKIIDPLFLEELKEELNEIKQFKQFATIKKKASDFQDKLSKLTFFDPACGSGNFLTETYLSLRELENQALVLIHGDNVLLDTNANLIQVSLDQFYGIEVNDFAVSVAKTALWIAESQMFEKTKDLIYSEIDFLPLKSYTNIIEGNALKEDWNDVVPINKLNFIIGNPPFIGAEYQTSQQKSEMRAIFGKKSKLKNLDYVASWFIKTMQVMNINQSIRASLVSTNSIAQGEQVETLWRPLLDNGITIDFAYQTFEWNNETKGKASVHCVIIGFSKEYIQNDQNTLYSSSGAIDKVKNISPYLVEGPNLIVREARKSLSKMPKMMKGNQPTEGGNLLLSPKEKEELLTEDPTAEQWIKKFMGAREFIQGKERYCLWFADADMRVVRKHPLLMERIENVKKMRLASKDAGTRKKAETPWLFRETNNPEKTLVIPATSSEKRKYIPIGYVDESVILSNAVLTIPEGDLTLFSLLNSNVHMSWMRVVAGRLKSDYRYSAFIVYNTFPFIRLDNNMKKELEKTAKEILQARSLYPDWSMADLYDDIIMPTELRKAHQNNDKAVMEAYGMPIGKTTESDAVAKLFEIYKELIEE